MSETDGNEPIQGKLIGVDYVLQQGDDQYQLAAQELDLVKPDAPADDEGFDEEELEVDLRTVAYVEDIFSDLEAGRRQLVDPRTGYLVIDNRPFSHVSVEDDKATCVPSTSAFTAEEPAVSSEVSRPSGPTPVPPSVSSTVPSSSPTLTTALPPSQPTARPVKAARRPIVPAPRPFRPVPQKRTAVILSEEPQASTSAASPGDVSQPALHSDQPCQPAQPGPSSQDDLYMSRTTGAEREELERGIERGIAWSAPPMTSDVPLPPALPRPTTLQQGTRGPLHQFHLPENTAGMAKSRRRQRSPRQPPSTSGPPVPILPYPLIMVQGTQDNPPYIIPLPPNYKPPRPTATATRATASPTLDPLQPFLVTNPHPPAPPPTTKSRSTEWYRKRRQEADPSKPVAKRRAFVCKLCGKERSSSNHTQYCGAWWCQEKSGPYADWLETRKKDLAEKKKKKKEDQ